MDPDNAALGSARTLIGQVVGGRYHIVDLVGEGGMGVVYKAEQRLGSAVRRVAVKTLHAELSRDPAVTARFHREVGTVAQLEHPNTVRVYDFGSTDDGTLYIAMEYLDGLPLNRVIESEGALEPKRVGHILRQVAGSLDEAHRQGIIHRDLKPENVLLIERAGEKDVVKLVDFGIAARTESADREKEQKLTQQGMVLGTPPYMSPEQFTGKPLDARSDVYSLAVMAYEMLTGQLPFQADTPWQWATHHMTSQPRSFDEAPSGARIPQPLRRAVLKGLAKDPGDRQSGAGEFYAEFAAALGMVTSVAPPNAPAKDKTEAMPQAAPPMALAATEYMPAAPGGGAPVVPSPPIALPPAPQRERSPGGRGLIYGLMGVSAILLVAMVAVALTQGGDREGDATPIALTPAQGTDTPKPQTPDTVEAPELTPSPPEETEPDEASPRRATPRSPKPAAPKPSPPAPRAPAPKPSPTPPTAPPVKTAPPAAAPQPTPQPSAPTPPVTQPAPPPRAPAADPCAACAKAVSDRSFELAARSYDQCTEARAKARCTAVMAQFAPDAARTAAFNGECAKARAIISQAQRMRVPAGQLAKASAAAAKCGY